MLLQISKQSIEACVSYSDSKKCCEKKSFEGTYLGNGLVDSAPILELEVPHPEEICIEKFISFSKKCNVFFTPVKSTCVCYMLSRAAQHTTMYLGQ